MIEGDDAGLQSTAGYIPKQHAAEPASGRIVNMPRGRVDSAPYTSVHVTRDVTRSQRPAPFCQRRPPVHETMADKS